MSVITDNIDKVQYSSNIPVDKILTPVIKGEITTAAGSSGATRGNWVMVKDLSLEGLYVQNSYFSEGRWSDDGGTTWAPLNNPINRTKVDNYNGPDAVLLCIVSFGFVYVQLNNQTTSPKTAKFEIFLFDTVKATS